jgi:hypothetical protein
MNLHHLEALNTPVVYYLNSNARVLARLKGQRVCAAIGSGKPQVNLRVIEGKASSASESQHQGL